MTDNTVRKRPMTPAAETTSGPTRNVLTREHPQGVVMTMDEARAYYKKMHWHFDEDGVPSAPASRPAPHPVKPAPRTPVRGPAFSATSAKDAPLGENAALDLCRATMCRKDTAASIADLLGEDTVYEDWDELTALGASGLDALARKMGREAAEEYADGASEVFDLDGLAPDDAELDDLYDAEAPAPAHGGLFYRQGLHLLVAPSETGKTWLALGATIPATPWEVDAGVSSIARPYGVYVDADGNGLSNMFVRAAQLDCGRARVDAGDIRMLSLPEIAAKRRCGMREALTGIIAGLAAEDHLPDVIVIDSMTQLLALADGDSNSDVTVTAALNQFRALSEQTCVIVIDHVNLSDATRPRGSGAKREAVDVVIMMSPIPQDPKNYPDTVVAARLSASKDRHHGIRAALAAPGEDPNALGTWVLKRTGDTVEVGKRRVRREDRLTSDVISARASAEKRDRDAKKQAATAPGKVAAVVAAAPGGEVCSRGKLVDMLRGEGMAKNAADDAITAAVAAGAVVAVKRGKAMVYSPAEPPQNVS